MNAHAPPRLAQRLPAVAALDALVLAIYAAVAGRDPGVLVTALLLHALPFAALLMLAGGWLDRRLVQALPDRAAARLRTLPRDAGLLAGLLTLLHAGRLFDSALLTAAPGAVRALPGDIRGVGLAWYLTAYAALYGLFAHALAQDLQGRLRIEAAARGHAGFPAGEGTLARRLGVAFGATLAVPVLLLIADFTWLAPLRAAQGLTAAQIVLLDTFAAAVILGAVLAVTLRGVLRGVRLLEHGQAALARGGGGLLPVASDDELGRLAEGFNRMRSAVREREYLRQALTTYVGDGAWQSLQQVPAGTAPAQQATVMFTDIAGFTGLSERCPPERLLAILRDYFATLVGVVERHGGHVDNFVGDAIVAVFNLDGRQGDHAARAMAAAREIAAITETRQFAGETLRTRIGLHSGPVAAGEVGSASRRGFSVFGDTVNVAARLEGENKHFDTVILASESVIAGAGLPGGFTACGSTALRGRREPVRVFGLPRRPAAAMAV